MSNYVSCVAIAGIALLGIVALIKGIDGVALMGCLTAISGLAGYHLGKNV
jgi:hypothetical protein